MSLAFRLTFFLIVGVAAVATGFAYYQVHMERIGLERDLGQHALNLAEAQAKAIRPAMLRGAYRELQALVDRSSDRDQPIGIAVYDTHGLPLAISSRLVARTNAMPPPILPGREEENGSTEFVQLNGALTHVAAVPIRSGSDVLGTLEVFQDASYIPLRAAATWRRTIASVGLQTILILAVTIVTLRFSLGRPVLQMAQWLRGLRVGAESDAPRLPGDP